MSNMLKIGAKFLNDQRHTHMSEAVRYLRDGFQEVLLQARIGRTETDSIDHDGLVIQHKSRDFIIQVADLIIDGSLTVPMKGDMITESDGAGSNFIYEVLSENGGAVHSPSDAYRNAHRVHTKLLRRELQ